MPALISQETLRRGTPTRNGAAYPRPHTSRLAAALARRTSRSDKAADHDLARVRDTLRHLAAIVAADPSLAGQVAALMAPAAHAVAVPSVPKLDAGLILAAQTADLDEEGAEAAYHANPCRETLMAWRAKLSAQISTSRALIAAVGEEVAE